MRKTTQLVFGGKEYDLKTDHTEIKKQIKGWEIKIDEITGRSIGDNKVSYQDVMDIIEDISHEMGAINM